MTCTPNILKTIGDVSGVFWSILCHSLPCFHLISKVIAADFQDELAPENTLDFQTSFDLDLVFYKQQICWEIEGEFSGAVFRRSVKTMFMTP